MNLIYYFALHQQLRENSAETEVTVRNHSFAVIRIQTALCTVNVSKTDKNMLSETIINMQKFTLVYRNTNYYMHAQINFSKLYNLFIYVYVTCIKIRVVYSFSPQL